LASEVFVSAMMLITAVVASAILIMAVFPIVWTMVSTFSSASHDTDTRMRTDFKIVTYYASESNQIAKIWLKNIGSNSIGASEIVKSDVFFGPRGNFDRSTLNSVLMIPPPLTTPMIPLNPGQWCVALDDTTPNTIWETGETLEIDVKSSAITGSSDPKYIKSGQYVYFQFVLPNGVFRSVEFTASD